MRKAWFGVAGLVVVATAIGFMPVRVNIPASTVGSTYVSGVRDADCGSSAGTLIKYRSNKVPDDYYSFLQSDSPPSGPGYSEQYAVARSACLQGTRPYLVAIALLIVVAVVLAGSLIKKGSDPVGGLTNDAA